MREDVKDLFDKERNILFIFAFKEYLETQVEASRIRHDGLPVTCDGYTSLKETLDAFHRLFDEYGVS